MCPTVPVALLTVCRLCLAVFPPRSFFLSFSFSFSLALALALALCPSLLLRPQRSFVDRIYSVVEEYAPGFASSVMAEDILTPLDLERVFGLHKGNINHMGLAPYQIGYARPAPGAAHHRTPLGNLYLCGAGAHPGGGVMGAAGRNCATVVLEDTM